MRHRFEPILAPDESWMVFDIHLGGPAELDGRSLIGLPASECGEIARRMNREHVEETSCGEAGCLDPCKQEQLRWKN
jgi:hypothetical protein